MKLHEKDSKIVHSNNKRLSNRKLITLIAETHVQLFTLGYESFDEALIINLEKLAEYLDFDCVNIWQAKELDSKKVYTLRYGWLKPEEDLKTELPTFHEARVIPRNNDWDSKLFSKKGYLSGLASSFETELRTLMNEKQVIGVIAFPIFIQEKFWGYISFENRHDKRLCSKNEATILQENSHLIGNAIKNNDNIISLNERLAQALQASKAKSDFLSQMSHEIRTPMSGIIGMTKIGKDATDIPKKDFALGKIEDVSTHLLGVINDILDISKIEANKLELSPINFELEKTIQKVVNIVGFRLEERMQKLYINIDKTIPRRMYGDDQRITQVIINLLSNAIKFTPESGTIHLDAKLLSETEDGLCLQISVADSGIGITEEQKERIFTSFGQASANTTRNYGGTGLGLPISKKIINMMGGNIWIESELDKGSTFIFTINLERALEKEDKESNNQTNWENLRIFVVDDDPEIRKYFAEMAESVGITCEVASSGEEAIILTAFANNFNIYFINSNLPDMESINLTKMILAKDFHKDIVIMSSSTDFNQIEPEFKEIGAGRFITKPLFYSSIINVINECLGIEAIVNQKAIQETPDLSKYRVILAEDNEINQIIVLSQLEATGIDITCVNNGQEALDEFAKDPSKYDLILMDIQMPIMDGYSATQNIRNLNVSWAKDIPIVAMTGNVFKEDIEKCLSVGMNAHLAKPFDPDEVIKVLKKYLLPLSEGTTTLGNSNVRKKELLQ